MKKYLTVMMLISSFSYGAGALRSHLDYKCSAANSICIKGITSFNSDTGKISFSGTLYNVNRQGKIKVSFEASSNLNGNKSYMASGKILTASGQASEKIEHSFTNKSSIGKTDMEWQVGFIRYLDDPIVVPESVIKFRELLERSKHLPEGHEVIR